MPLGISLMPLETRREAIRHLATGADRAGWDAFFFPETGADSPWLDAPCFRRRGSVPRWRSWEYRSRR